MAVARIDHQRCLALCVDAEGARHTVEIALVDTVTTGSVLLIHAGVAIAAFAGEVPV
jgi:hydrogenase maturation factor